MYDTLLFLHLLSAFIAFVTIATFSAYALGAPVGRGDFALADWCWNVSGVGLLIFGIWLALDVDGYAIWDGWILAAIVLFVASGAFGAIARTRVLATLGDDAAASGGGGTVTATAAATAVQVTVWHWLRTAAIVAVLVLMVWKPGA